MWQSMVYNEDLLFNQPKLIYQLLLAQKTRCFLIPLELNQKEMIFTCF